MVFGFDGKNDQCMIWGEKVSCFAICCLKVLDFQRGWFGVFLPYSHFASATLTAIDSGPIDIYYIYSVISFGT